jgi:nitrate reductase gamma subunit
MLETSSLLLTSPPLRFAEHTLQIVALSFMAIVYFFKILWILKFKAGKERQAATGNPHTTARKGATYSLFNVAMPWTMSSTRQHPLFYLQFTLFHIGVAIAIVMSLVMPYLPELLEPTAVVLVLQVLFAAAFVIGVGRLIRRFFSPYMRAISTPDDYFSIALLVVWFGFAFMAAPNNREVTEFWVMGFFLLTAFFLFYVPFSKISHYIYYPFTRWYLGKTLGHRGVYPMRIDRNDMLKDLFKPNPFTPGKEKS